MYYWPLWVSITASAVHNACDFCLFQTHDRLRVTLQSGKVSIFVNGKEKHAIDSGLEHHYAIVKFRFGALTARLTPRCGQYCPAGGETEGQGADCTGTCSGVVLRECQ